MDAADPQCLFQCETFNIIISLEYKFRFQSCLHFNEPEINTGYTFYILHYILLEHTCVRCMSDNHMVNVVTLSFSSYSFLCTV